MNYNIPFTPFRVFSIPALLVVMVFNQLMPAFSHSVSGKNRTQYLPILAIYLLTNLYFPIVVNAAIVPSAYTNI